MRVFLLLIQTLSLSIFDVGATTHLTYKNTLANNEINFLDLKLKKELNDKKLSSHKKYMLAVLAARELKRLKTPERAIAFYQIAKDTKINENKIEIMQALSKKNKKNDSIFFYDVNLKILLKNKSYERAILSINPDGLIKPDNRKYRIIYDLLNVKIKKRSITKLYCYDEYQKNPDDYQYSNLICGLLVDYLQNGKIGNDQIKVVEEYFFMHDLKERYLLQVVKDLKTSL